MKTTIWSVWVVLSYLFVYFCFCFIKWDIVDFGELTSDERGGFIVSGVLVMLLSFVLPGMLLDKVK